MDNRNIMIVEDDPLIRAITRRILESDGYGVFEAKNGLEAIEWLCAEKSPREICLILLDLMMPKMNGFEFFKVLRSKLQYSETPVLIVSAFADQAKDLPVQGLFEKPVDMDKLLGVARKYCG